MSVCVCVTVSGTERERDGETESESDRARERERERVRERESEKEVESRPTHRAPWRSFKSQICNVWRETRAPLFQKLLNSKVANT